MADEQKYPVDHNSGFLMWDEASTRIGSAEVAYNQFAKVMDEKEDNLPTPPKYCIRFYPAGRGPQNITLSLKLNLINSPYLSREEQNKIYDFQPTSVPWDGDLYYSLDEGQTYTLWEKEDYGKQITGTSIFLKGINNTNICRWFLIDREDTRFGYIFGLCYATFDFGKSNIECYGNLNNLLDYQLTENDEKPIVANFCFAGMFQEQNIITVPELPNKVIVDEQNEYNEGRFCFYYMFYSCKKIKDLPKLPEKLSIGCCAYMFSRCTSILKIPENYLVSDVPSFAYMGTFSNCSNLSNVEGSIINLKCILMHNEILRDSPTSGNKDNDYEIKTTKTTNGYNCDNMFNYSGLENIDNFNLIIDDKLEGLSYRAFSSMFVGCSKLTNVNLYLSNSNEISIYSSMFSSCRGLVNVNVELFKDSNSIGYQSCYNMFKQCYALLVAPNITQNEVGYYGCYGMFNSCSKLEKSPKILSEIVNESSFRQMFENCYNLKYIGSGLYPQEITKYTYFFMFKGCSKLQQLPKIYAKRVYRDSLGFSLEGLFNNISISENRTEDAINPYSIPYNKDADSHTMLRYTRNDYMIFKGLYTFYINREYYTNLEVVD